MNEESLKKSVSVEADNKIKNNFINDENKITYMIELSKQCFLNNYKEITDSEYENTKEIILQFVRSKKKLNQQLNENLNKDKLE